MVWSFDSVSNRKVLGVNLDKRIFMERCWICTRAKGRLKGQAKSHEAPGSSRTFLAAEHAQQSLSAGWNENTHCPLLGWSPGFMSQMSLRKVAPIDL